MRDYTEFYLNVELKKDVSKKIISILKFMLGNDNKLYVFLPKHELFSTNRWKSMLQTKSYCFDCDTHSTLKYYQIEKSYYLYIRCNLKNYDKEVENFCGWIKPYIYTEGFIGFKRHEKYYHPTLLYNTENAIIEKEIK